MTKDHFKKEMSILEVTFPSRPPLKPEEIELRREAMLDALEQFPDDVLTLARKEYLEEAEEEDAGWQQFPKPAQLRRICLEIVHTRKMKEIQKNKPPAKFGPVPHQCVDSKNQALPRKLLSIVLPYEAMHVYCDWKLAICPICGTQFEITNTGIESLMRMYPEDTVGWNPAHKGICWCQACRLKYGEKPLEGEVKK